MKIKKIQLSNYKRFNDLTIDLGESPKRIVALVGPNGCGKSSVFDGMSFLANAYGIGYGKNITLTDNFHDRYKNKKASFRYRKWGKG